MYNLEKRQKKSYNDRFIMTMTLMTGWFDTRLGQYSSED